MFLEGKIKTYNAEKGFGFIEIKGESQDIFFHVTDLPNKNVIPQVGETLRFSKVRDNGKIKAAEITRLGM